MHFISVAPDPVWSSQIRFIAVRHQVVDVDWAKVYVWGIDAFSPSPPPPVLSPPPPETNADAMDTPPGWNNMAGVVRAYSYQG